MSDAAIIPESTNSADDGAGLNRGAPYGVARAYSRTPAVISAKGTLTTFHACEDGSYGERVTEATATHVMVHSLTIYPVAASNEVQA